MEAKIVTNHRATEIRPQRTPTEFAGRLRGSFGLRNAKSVNAAIVSTAHSQIGTRIADVSVHVT